MRDPFMQISWRSVKPLPRYGRFSIFTARRYASAIYAVFVCPSISLSVCPSVRLFVCHKSELYKNG